MAFHTCACTCSHLQRPCTHSKDALCMLNCFWSPPLGRLLVGHTVILSSHSFVLWLHAQDKGFTDKGVHILTPTRMTASPWAPGCFIWASAGGVSRNLNPWGSWISKMRPEQRLDSIYNQPVGQLSNELISFHLLLHTLSTASTCRCGLSNDRCQSAEHLPVPCWVWETRLKRRPKR